MSKKKRQRHPDDALCEWSDASPTDEFALQPDAWEPSQDLCADRRFADALGSTRAGRMKLLFALRAGERIDNPVLLELEQRLRGQLRGEAALRTSYLDSQRDAAVRDDFPHVIELLNTRCEAWDTMGLRIGSNCIIFDAVVLHRGRPRRLEVMLGVHDLWFFLGLGQVARLSTPSDAVLRAFSRLARLHGCSAGRNDKGGVRLRWCIDGAALTMAQLVAAFERLLRLGDGLAKAFAAAHQQDGAQGLQMDIDDLVEGEVSKELYQ